MRAAVGVAIFFRERAMAESSEQQQQVGGGGEGGKEVLRMQDIPLERQSLELAVSHLRGRLEKDYLF